jgi:tetratricopeptide (TPR) repeat protein
VTAARVVLGLVAVMALAWLGAQERSRIATDRGLAAFADLRKARDEGARAERELRRAAQLNPDVQPDVLRALLYRVQGRWRLAQRTAAAVVRIEPDNAQAWAAYALVYQGHDPAAVRRARAEVRRLSPMRADAMPGRP